MFISAAVNRIINWFNSMFLFIVSLFDEVAYIDKTTKLPTLFSLPLLGHTYLFMCGKYIYINIIILINNGYLVHSYKWL